METTYSFDRSFRLKLLALCLDGNWMARYGNFIVKSEYFEREDEEAIAKALLEYIAKYKKTPDASDMLTLCGGEHKELISKLYNGYKKWDLSLASDMAVQFAKEQATKIAILESVDDVQNGINIQAAIDRMKLAMRIGEEIEFPGIDILDYKSWLYDYWQDKIPTGFMHIDSILEGGPARGEFCLVMAPQNAGKSMALINIGYGAASIVGGMNVVHFSHEMRAAQVAKRYAARISFRFPKKSDDLDQYAEEFIEAARKLLRGSIRIIRRKKKMTVLDIENELDRLEANDFHPDLIIDDYPDLLMSRRKYRDRRFELSEVCEDLRDLGDRRDSVVWGATQSSRRSFSKELITLADISEDIGKASIADIIVSVCRTKEEEDTDQCRLFMAKVRDGSSHDTIRAKFFGAQQAIITTGLAKERVSEEIDA